MGTSPSSTRRRRGSSKEVDPGHGQGLQALTRFISSVNKGCATEGLLRDMNTLKVTPLLKGNKGKIRPITVAGMLKRFALTSLMRSEKNLQEYVGPGEYAIGRKAACETLRRDIDIALQEVSQEHGSATAFQLDCSCAFNIMPR